MRYLNAEAVREALPMPAAIAAMRDAFLLDRETPPRVSLGPSKIMPGRLGGHIGVKLVSVAPGDPAGLVVICDRAGRPVGLVDGPTLTAIRTGAAAGLATALLARPEASSLAMLGAGAMAPDQVAAIKAVRDLRRILVWSPTRSRAERLAEQVGGEAVESPEAAVRAAEIVTTATPARTPLFLPEALGEHVHINAIGAFRPDMAEIPPGVVRSAYVVVDDYEASRLEAGDLIQAGRTPDADMAAILLRGAVPAARWTLFKTTGVANMDLAAAVAALAAAETRDIGQRLA